MHTTHAIEQKREKSERDLLESMHEYGYGTIFYLCIFITFRHQRTLFSVDMRCEYD